jgi:hypothetical protein
MPLPAPETSEKMPEKRQFLPGGWAADSAVDQAIQHALRKKAGDCCKKGERGSAQATAP